MDTLNYNSLYWFGHLAEEHLHIPDAHKKLTVQGGAVWFYA